MSYKPFVLEVAAGGTGLATQTAHSIYVGNGTSAPTAVSVGATGTVLAGATGADPAFTATPSVTSITIGGGTALSTYNEGTFTATMVGASTAGSTTYTAQNGYYRRIGNLVTIQAVITGSAATGTGNVLFGAFPFTVKNQTNGQCYGSINHANAAGFPWAASTTSATVQTLINSTTGQYVTCGTTTNGTAVQMANAAFNMQFTVTYEI